MNIYNLRTDIQETLDKYYACFNEDGEMIVTEEVYKEIEKSLFEFQNQKDELLTWYLQDRANKLASLPGIDEEIKRLSNLKSSISKKADRIENLLDFHFKELYQGKPLAFGNFTVSYRKSDPVFIEDEEKISILYKKSKVVTTIDKIAIKEAIKSGKIVEGAILEDKQNLQIK